MKDVIEKSLDQLDEDVHKLMVRTAMQFMEMGLDGIEDVVDSTGGVVTVMSSRHCHAIVAFLGAMLEAGAPSSSIRDTAGRMKESFGEMVDDAVLMAICQAALNETEAAIQ